MREIIPQQLWLGNTKDAGDLRRLLDTGIRAIVDLTLEELPPKLTREMVYCRFPLVDGAGNTPELLSAAIDTTASLICRQVPTLVFCGAGMSRSPAIVAAALAIAHGDAPDDCLQQLLAGNPRDVSPLLWNDVKEAHTGLLD